MTDWTIKPGLGGGKYGGEASRLMSQLSADVVVLCVINGRKGHGMAVKVRPCAIGPAMHEVAEMLRAIADDIDRGFSGAS